MEAGTKVLVTTGMDRRGVFGGVLKSYNATTGVCELTEARMAISWPSSTHGVLGLASIGPEKGCRISPKVPCLSLNGVTSVATITDDAWLNWEKELWL